MPDSAGRRAREVVGLYGDPDTTWGIGLDTVWLTPLDLDAVSVRLADLATVFAQLGAPLDLDVVAVAGWDESRTWALSTPYVDGQPVVRLMASDDGRRLFVGAHHGAVDGFGMVAVIARALAVEIDTGARGVGSVPPHSSFLSSSLKRLVEALVDPPPRFRGTGAGRVLTGAPGENVSQIDLPPRRASTAVVSHAVAQAFTEWPVRTGRGGPLLVTGVSRRAAGDRTPDRQTGFVRFRVNPDWDLATTKARFHAVVPEPDFPETSVGGIGPRVIRLLRNRLGSTAQVSNIGLLQAPGLERAALFPAVSGPWAVSFGTVSTPTVTTLTVRTRTSEFTADETDELARRVAERL